MREECVFRFTLGEVLVAARERVAVFEAKAERHRLGLNDGSGLHDVRRMQEAVDKQVEYDWWVTMLSSKYRPPDGDYPEHRIKLTDGVLSLTVNDVVYFGLEDTAEKSP